MSIRFKDEGLDHQEKESLFKKVMLIGWILSAFTLAVTVLLVFIKIAHELLK
jgi:hypothetical protein